MVYLFSYNREFFLTRILKTLRNEEILILDDGSDFDLARLNTPYRVFPHKGREGFWEIWGFALGHAKQTKDDFFMFTQDDILDIDIAKVHQYHEQYKHKPYAHHIINDGSHRRWGRSSTKKISPTTYLSGWVDCIFFCNRAALEKLHFKIQPVPARRFKNRLISSGVGEQLTNRFEKLKVPIYKPVHSLATHGDIPSKMHPEARRKHPLKARRRQ